MKTVVFEGPDEAGKTTLINATARVLDNVSLPFSVIKSPAGRERAWHPSWDRWSDTQGLQEMTTDVAKHVFLLDRTPEISEFVYGVLRQHTRLFNPLETLDRFPVGDKMLVLCLPKYHLNTTEQHFDPFGDDVGFKSAGQHLLYSAIHQLYSPARRMPYFRWDRFAKPDDGWAHYLVSLGSYIGLSPNDLKTTFYTDPSEFFPKEAK